MNVVNITALPDLGTKIGWEYFGLNVLLGAAFLYFSFREPVTTQPST